MSRLAQGQEAFVTAKGVLTHASRLFLQVLQDIIDGSIELPYRFLDFDNLAAIDAFFPNPSNNMIVIVNGQGLARFKESVGDWVLASDDTTLIT